MGRGAGGGMTGQPLGCRPCGRSSLREAVSLLQPQLITVVNDDVRQPTVFTYCLLSLRSGYFRLLLYS